MRVSADAAALRRLTLLPRSIGLFRDGLSRAVAEGAVERLRRRMPRRSGALVASLGMRRGGPASYVVFYGGPRAPHAAYLERGTRPHVISARGGVLVFESGGAVVFARRVHHPGTRPMRLARRTASEMRGEAARRARRELRKALR